MAGLPEEAEKLGCPEVVARLFCLEPPECKGEYMELPGGVNPYNSHRFGFGYIDTIHRQRAVSISQSRASISVDRDQSIHTMQQVMRMREAVKSVEPRRLESQEIQAASPANATSASSLGLDMTATATTLQSTEEVNTTPTSYSTHGPEWTGSTAQVTLSGEYDGSNGTDTLTFKSDKTGTHGEDDLTIKIYDSNNDEIDKIDIKKDDAIDRQYTLDNGLILTLGAGELVEDDTFTIEVDGSQPTSFSPAQPDWNGSNALATIGGVYDGSNGTDTLTFIASNGGTHGSDDIQIKVYDSNNQQVDQFDIKKEDPIDKQYTLDNGLTFTLGEGNVLKFTTFSLEVFDSTGTAVDPDKPFNGKRIDDPDLEPGLSVSDGSFQINGATIDVNASESINDVLDRINQSSAGVTATFDIATERVLLTQNTTGSAPDIVLENDTSGFLAAMKLDGETATPGEDAEPDKSLAQVTAFSAVRNGSISVNGVSIAIDVNADSLNDVLDRISASAAGVTASFDSASQKVTLTSDNADSQMTLSDGGTQFFSAVRISEGAYNSQNDIIEAQARGVNVVDVTNLVIDSIVEENAEKPWEIQESEATPVPAADGQMLTALVKNIAHSMNALFDDSAFKDSPGVFLESVRNGIRSAVTSTFGSEGPRFNTDFGIQLDFSSNNGRVFNFSADNQQRFETALSTPEGAASARNTLFGNESQGLFNQLHTTLTASASAFENQSDPTGIFVDVSI